MFKITMLVISVFLLFTTQTSANRPGLEHRSETTQSPTPTAQSKMVVQQTTGDVLEINQGETIKIVPLNFPSRGMAMKKVLEVLGKPQKTLPAVGKPPIRQWVYNDRTVYFENMTVIHVVATH